MEGWIKIHRKMLDNPIICKDSDYLSVWIYLLANATHKEIPALFKGQKIILKQGQLITGRKSIASKLKISESKIYRIINDFKSEQQIEQQASNKNSLITIINWDKYQQNEQQIETQMNNKRTTSEQQVNTNKNERMYKNDKNVRTTTISDSCVDGLNVNDSCVNDLHEIIEFYNQNVGMITPYGAQVISSFCEDMDKELIILAMQKAVEANIRTIQYIKGILNNWAKKGIKTVLEAQQEDEKFKNKNTGETQEEKQERRRKQLEEALSKIGTS